VDSGGNRVSDRSERGSYRRYSPLLDRARENADAELTNRQWQPHLHGHGGPGGDGQPRLRQRTYANVNGPDTLANTADDTFTPGPHVRLFLPGAGRMANICHRSSNNPDLPRLRQMEAKTRGVRRMPDLRVLVPSGELMPLIILPPCGRPGACGLSLKVFASLELLR
jgi:hypothetical protein